MDDDWPARLDAYRQDMPAEWALRWQSPLTNMKDVLVFIRSVVEAGNGGQLEIAQAGCVLRPFVMHPITVLYRSGELTEIGFHGDSLWQDRGLPTRDDAKYDWSEIEAGLARLEADN
jgi:hypothetical protein